MAKKVVVGSDDEKVSSKKTHLRDVSGTVIYKSDDASNVPQHSMTKTSEFGYDNTTLKRNIQNDVQQEMGKIFSVIKYLLCIIYLIYKIMLLFVDLLCAIQALQDELNKKEAKVQQQQTKIDQLEAELALNAKELKKRETEWKSKNIKGYERHIS